MAKRRRRSEADLRIGYMEAGDEKALHGLLVEVFTADELRRWVRFSFGREVSDSLPWNASLSELAFQTVQLVSRLRRFDELFDALAVERPGHSDRIGRLRTLWCDPVAQRIEGQAAGNRNPTFDVPGAPGTSFDAYQATPAAMQLAVFASIGAVVVVGAMSLMYGTCEDVPGNAGTERESVASHRNRKFCKKRLEHGVSITRRTVAGDPLWAPHCDNLEPGLYGIRVRITANVSSHGAFRVGVDGPGVDCSPCEAEFGVGQSSETLHGTTCVDPGGDTGVYLTAIECDAKTCSLTAHSTTVSLTRIDQCMWTHDLTVLE